MRPVETHAHNLSLCLQHCILCGSMKGGVAKALHPYYVRRFTATIGMAGRYHLSTFHRGVHGLAANLPFNLKKYPLEFTLDIFILELSNLNAIHVFTSPSGYHYH